MLRAKEPTASHLVPGTQLGLDNELLDVADIVVMCMSLDKRKQCCLRINTLSIWFYKNTSSTKALGRGAKNELL